MQVTPAAGKYIAKKFKVTYNEKKLLSDPVYNVQFGAAELEQYASELSGQLPELFVHLPAPARREVLARLDSLAREHPLAAVRDRLNALQPTLLAIEDDMRAKSTGAEPILTGALP